MDDREVLKPPSVRARPRPRSERLDPRESLRRRKRARRRLRRSGLSGMLRERGDGAWVVGNVVWAGGSRCHSWTNTVARRNVTGCLRSPRPRGARRRWRRLSIERRCRHATRAGPDDGGDPEPPGEAAARRLAQLYACALAPAVTRTRGFHVPDRRGCRRSAVAVHRRLSADRAAWRRNVTGRAFRRRRRQLRLSVLGAPSERRKAARG
jgi:hypothetical protein